MALGNGNDDNNDKKYWDPTVYSSYKMSNTEGVDPSALSIAFYKGMLKISISPMKKGTDKIAFDHENNIVVYLTHTKARMLWHEIRNVLDNPKTVNNGGVNTGTDGLISFSNGKELGVANPCLIIRKISEAGEVTSAYAYEFKINYHFSVRNFDAGAKKHEKYHYNNLEVEQFMTLLKEFFESATGAVAYSVIEESKYSNSRMNTKIDSIMNNLGIKYDKPAYGGKGGSNRSYFNNNNSGGGASGAMNAPESSSSMRSSSLDDIANDLED